MVYLKPHRHPHWLPTSGSSPTRHPVLPTSGHLPFIYQGQTPKPPMHRGHYYASCPWSVCFSPSDLSQPPCHRQSSQFLPSSYIFRGPQKPEDSILVSVNSSLEPPHIHSRTQHPGDKSRLNQNPLPHRLREAEVSS